MKEAKLLAFLEGQPATVVAFVLHHERDGRSQVVCRSVEGEAKTETAARFRVTAHQRADHYGGQQVFAVGSFDEDSKLVDSIGFRVGSDMGDMGPLGDPGPTNEQGANVGFARALNTRDTASRKLLGDLHTDFRRELEKKSRRIDKLEALLDQRDAERMKWIESFEKLKSEAHDRKLRQIESMQDAKNKEWVIAQLATIAPLVVSSLSGSSLLEKLLATFSQPQVDAFLTVLDDKQRPMVEKLLTNAKAANVAKARLASA